MMIVDLVDEVDFKEKLMALGVPVTQEQSLLEVKSALTQWMQDFPEQVPFIRAVCIELKSDNTTLLPEVSDLVESII